MKFEKFEISSCIIVPGQTLTMEKRGLDDTALEPESL